MQKIVFKDRYTIWKCEIEKNKIIYSDIEEIISYFKHKIKTHPFAKYLFLFDHYKHIKSINGKILPDVIDMKNIVFCYGPDILDIEIAALRPRSIGICELKDSYIIEFMQAPSDKAHESMVEWTKELLVK